MSFLKKLFSVSTSSKSHSQRLSGRRLRFEHLENRELLSVSTTDFDAIRASYADLNLSANMNDYNIIEIQASNLTRQSLADAVNEAGKFHEKADDLIIIRTTATQNTISFTYYDSNAITIDTKSAEMGSGMGKVFIIGVREDSDTGEILVNETPPLTIDANNYNRAFNITSADVTFAGLNIIDGKVSTNNTSAKITTGNGGAIANIGGYVTLAYSTISNSSVTGTRSCGGAIYSENGELNVIQSTISENKAVITNGYGGGVYISGSKANFTNSIITLNEGQYGGGIASVLGAKVTLDETTVSDNKTNDTKATTEFGGRFGGGIYSSESSLSITNSEITSNDAMDQGGGIYYIKGKAVLPVLSIKNSIISENYARTTASTGEGGAIYTDASVTIDGGTFENNHANKGAAIAVFDSGSTTYAMTLDIANSKFIGNIATSRGGAIEMPNTQSTLIILKTTFDSNKSDSSEGGAIYNTAKTATITDSIFSNNIATRGGAIFTTGAMTISGLSSVFSNNTANKTQGGAIYSNATTAAKAVTINGATITGNHAQSDGGGVYVGSYAKITDCTITNNSALADGGGLRVGAETLIQSSFIAGNNSVSEGGGIYVYGSKTKVHNSVIAGNYAISNGGGVFGILLEVTNSTIVGNISDKGGGGWYYNSTTAVTMINSIVAKNTAKGTEGGHDIRTSYANKLNVTYSLIGNNATGTGKGFAGSVGNKINVDPVFVTYTDYHSWTENRWKSWNLQLNTGSIAINNGNNGLIPTGITTDVRGIGYYRIVGTTVDMGAYEFGNTLVMTAPTGSGLPKEDSVVLTWEDVASARSYEIYRVNESNELIGPPLGTTLKANRTWIDTGLPPGTYRYAIIAVNGTDRSAVDADKIIEATVGILPPEGPLATVSGNTVILTWDAVADASHYLIYRNDAYGNDIQVGDVTGTTWSDFGLNPGTYNYAVYSVDANNAKKSLGTAKATILPPMPTPPTISATPNESGIVTITWAAIPNAEGYEVSRKLVGGSGTWEKVHDDRLIGTSCIDYLAPEGDVMYIVRAVNAVGSAASDPVTVYIDKPPAAPDLIVTLLDNGRVSLSWTIVAGAINYEISRQTSSSANPEIINASWYGTSFIDMTPPEGSVVYLVRALESVHSSLYGISGVFVEPQEVTVGKPVVLATVIANQTVSLMWDDTENATEYVVSRRTVNNPSWLELTTTSGTGFVDTTPPLGTVEYAVTAKHGLSSTKSDNVNVSVSLAAPIVEISQDNPNEISLTWEAVSNAAYYSVWTKIGTAAWTRLTMGNNFTGTEYTITNPPSGTVKYGVKAHNGTYVSAMNAETVDIPVVIPAPVIAAEFQGNRTVSVTWNAVSNATSYTVYRRATDTIGWTQVNTAALTTPGFTDTNVSFGDWDYCVVAANDSITSPDSNVTQVSVTLDAPSTIQASVGSSGATITWSAVSDATHYSVWIKIGDASWTKIANQVSGTSFVDSNPPSGSVKYGVKAHSGSNASARKNTKAITVPLSVPSTMTATLPGDGSVNLTWDAVSDATYYSVHVKNSDGTWTSLASNVTSTSFTDVTPTSGTVEYGIKAHNATLTSDIVSATITVPTPRPPFGAPEVQATLQSDGSVQITWGEVEDATNYSVWYKETGGSWTKLTNNGTGGSYTVTNPPTGNVQFTVKAHNGMVVSGISPVALYIPGATPLPEFGAPEVQAQLQQDDGTVVITWGEVQDATNYSVWYKETGGTWVKLTNNGINGSYTVTSPPVGTVQFTVKAHNGTIVSGISPVTLTIV